MPFSTTFCALAEINFQLADVESLNAACGAFTVDRISVQLGEGSISLPTLLELGSDYNVTASKSESGTSSSSPV